MPRFLLDSTKRASRRGLLGKLENIAVYLILFFLCFAAVILAFPANGQLQGCLLYTSETGRGWM